MSYTHSPGNGGRDVVGYGNLQQSCLDGETPVPQPMDQIPVGMPFLPLTMSSLGMDPLYNPLHLFQQGVPPPVLVPTESSNQVPNNVASASQVPIPTPIPPLNQMNVGNQEEVDDVLELLRETRTKIVVLREIKIMVYKEKSEKKLISICHPRLLKSSLDIRPPTNPRLGNYILVMNPTLRETNRQAGARRNLPLMVPPHMIGSMNLIIWNCGGGNGPEFRRNFRSLLDWHKPPLVALLETKMQNHISLLEEFPFTRMIEVPTIGNSGGIVVLWDDAILELDEITTTNQEVHAIIKETMWASHPEFGKIVENAWENKRNLLEALGVLEKDLTTWKHTTFRDIFRKKRTLLKRIQGIQASPNYCNSEFLIDLENKLIKDYNETLKNEEDYWKLKSRFNWLNEGDANTKFFHTSTLNRRRRNKILSLRTDSGSWIYDQQEITEYTFNYSSKLFDTNHIQSPREFNEVDTNAPDENMPMIGEDLLDEEVSNAIYSFEPYKAPGPDGIHPFFYQKYWSIVGPTVKDFCK
ncbi:hypothetical protein H5410_007138 [Solanum commersonii]|uniref:Uncharacterized protein n=1 Tax=Solanum commersonii TaxID=4109 RepID=A0A9J6ABN1_SOLCO|nr:hypothetical protein H5410_007138 [Solanum commersonii]